MFIKSNEAAAPQELNTAAEVKPNYLSKEVAQQAKAITREFPAGNPTGNEFPIIAYEHFPHSEIMTAYDPSASTVSPKVDCETGLYKKMKECGFNMVLWADLLIGPRYFSEKSLLKFYIPLAMNQGIRFGFMCESVALRTYPTLDQPKYEGSSILAYMVPKLEEFLENYGSVDWVWGWMFKDEPAADAWRLPLDQMPDTTVPLETNYNLCTVNAPAKVSFFNLACAVTDGVIGSEIAGKKNIYDNVLSIKEQYMLYLGELCRTVHPKMLTYDFYPIHYKLEDHVATNTLEVRADYFQYLEALGEFSQLNGMPIWAFILSNQHNLYNVHQEGDDLIRDSLATAYPLPTEGVLRFQAFNAMAFGMQGIVYWTYSMPPMDMRDRGWIKYINAPVNFEETPSSGSSDSGEEKPPYRYTYTSIWQAAKAVNAEIKQYGKILLGAKYLESKHVYGPKKEVQFIGAKELGSSAIGCIRSASTNGKGFVICRLKKDDVNYLAIVSHDPAESQKITLGISAKYYCYRGEYGINALPIDYTPGPNQNPATVVNFAFNLLPGDMIILSYKHRLVDA